MNHQSDGRSPRHVHDELLEQLITHATNYQAALGRYNEWYAGECQRTKDEGLTWLAALRKADVEMITMKVQEQIAQVRDPQLGIGQGGIIGC